MIPVLEEDQRNKLIPLEEVNQSHQKLFQMKGKGTFYYPYNLDVNDKGWGCAWRAAQTLLSSAQKYIPFQQLFDKYSKKQLLLKTLKEKQELSAQQTQVINTRKWAPEELESRWAEPFIASLTLWDLKIPNSLFLLNKYMEHANAPEFVFEKVINFKEFVQIIKIHIHKITIMIDDANYALSIVGYASPDQQTVELLFADPHISSNREHRNVGIYSKSFDLEGLPKEGQEERLTEHQKQQALYNVYQKLEFKAKPWMICFIKT